MSGRCAAPSGSTPTCGRWCTASSTRDGGGSPRPSLRAWCRFFMKLPTRRMWCRCRWLPRLKARGYNQAEQLATALGRLSGLPVRSDRLHRRRETPTQTRLGPEHRRANLAEAFAARDCHRAVILVDDVFTTGATLCSAAAELLDRGAGQVGAVTFARAALPLETVVERRGSGQGSSP